MKVENLLLELQMITGIISNDPVFLYNEMLKGGSSSEDNPKEEFIETHNATGVETTMDIDDWFNKL